jgi:hypothetical protein
VFIIAQEPLLDAALSADQTRSLTLYGHPGRSYEIQVTTNLLGPIEWQPWTETALVGPFAVLSPVLETSPHLFYLARQIEQLGVPLTIRREDERVIIEWPLKCAGCVLEETLALESQAWTPSAEQPLEAAGRYRVTLSDPVGTRFYRLSIP